MPLYYAAIRITALPEEAAGAAEDLENHIHALQGEGRVRLSCRYEKQEGYLVVFQAEDLLDARDTVEAFPLVREGLAAWSYRAVELIGDRPDPGRPTGREP